MSRNIIAAMAVVALLASSGIASARPKSHANAHLWQGYYDYSGRYQPTIYDNPIYRNLYNSVPIPSNDENWPVNQPYPCNTLPSFCDPDFSNGG